MYKLCFLFMSKLLAGNWTDLSRVNKVHIGFALVIINYPKELVEAQLKL